MRFILLLLSFSISLPCWSQIQQHPDSLLPELVRFYWEYQLKEFPLWATSVGHHQFNDRVGSYTLEDYSRRAAIYDSLLTVLSQWQDYNFSPDRRIEYQLIHYQLKDDLATIRFNGHLIPLSADGGFHIRFSFLPTQMPFNTIKDYQNYIRRLEEFPRYVDEHIHLLREGIKLGMTQPQVIFNGYEVTYNTHLVEDHRQSQFFKPFRELPSIITATQHDSLIIRAALAIQQVVEGYRGFGEFMENEYIPAARNTLGASELPQGKAYYQQRIEHYTTLSTDAKQVHQLGLKEVSRIRSQMLDIVRELGFGEDLTGFIHHLKTDNSYYAATPEHLLQYASWLAKKADAALPMFFENLPRQPYGVAPVPAHLAPKYTGGRYVPADIRSQQPGYYWVNTYNLPSRPLYVLPALTLHEAVPGHHLQIALSQELEGFSLFRKNLYISAFGEGWGLYSEYLGKEMSMYTDPYMEFGRLTYEMWRACRLVVDTGIHAFGWTRDQVIEYLQAHTALSDHEITTETDRYIGWPGQALSYKMGELKIKELRQYARKALGANFDLRKFHDLILSQGTLTLPLLEELVIDFVDKHQ